MATMAMVMVKKPNKKLALLVTLTALPHLALAGDWVFKPDLALDETYTNNVELTPDDKKSSLVSQLKAGLAAKFTSRDVNFSFAGEEIYAIYSHDSDLNDDYQTATFDGSISLWPSGPVLVANSRLTNISQNTANNSLADLVSSDTVQRRAHNAGIEYQAMNSSYSFAGSLLYNLIETEDNLGESKGYTASIYSNNGTSARNVFWSVSSQYTDRENTNTTGTNYNVEAQIGAITSFKLNPFIRYYDEDIRGNAADTTQSLTRSWGPGLRWLASDHLYIDLSYNFVEDKTTSDNYIATSINWQPSQRTSLEAAYNQRFFGDSYELDLSHKTKRLTNRISYNELIEIYDRYSFQEVDLGQFWCPNGSPASIDNCLPSSDQPSDVTDYSLLSFTNLVPVQSDEFSLNKRLSWTSTLALSRTTFDFNIATRERESLSTGIIDDNLDVSLSATRKLSSRSSWRLLLSYRDATFDKHYTPTNARQEDTYKTASATFSKKLASELSTDFTLQYLERDSSETTRTYDEVRAYINIRKDF